MSAGRRIAIAFAVLVFAGVGAGAAAAGIHHDVSLSVNWAGYAVNGTNAATGAPTSFSVVSGSWTIPTVNCAQSSTWSSVWVGLGGFARGSAALEQVGTDADCVGLTPTYFAWYELVPAASVQLRLKVSAGDHMTGLVIVKGTRVGFRLRDVTRGTTFTKYVAASLLDLTSAEWVVEAPSQCDDSFHCRVLPLSNFGSITLTGGAAVGDGHAGTIADTAWASTPIELLTRDPQTQLPTGVGAVPSDLGADGGSFTVAYATNLSLPLPPP